jgi:hypothetical protein
MEAKRKKRAELHQQSQDAHTRVIVEEQPVKSNPQSAHRVNSDDKRSLLLLPQHPTPPIEVDKEEDKDGAVTAKATGKKWASMSISKIIENSKPKSVKDERVKSKDTTDAKTGETTEFFH